MQSTPPRLGLRAVALCFAVTLSIGVAAAEPLTVAQAAIPAPIIHGGDAPSVMAGPTDTFATAEAEADLLAVPTRLDRIGRIIVPVTINGQGPFRFIVDTGASHSTVSPGLAAKLGLKSTAEAGIRVNGITGTALVPGVTIAKLQAGDLTIEDTNLPVVWAPLMGGADGILGAAGLKAQRLLVDFDRNKVVLSHAGLSGTPAGFVRIPARRLDGGLVAVDAKVGRVSVRAVIDTGSERTLGNIALRDALKRQPRPGEQARVTTVYGATTEVASGDVQIAPTISVGALRIVDVTLVYGNFHIFKVWEMENKPALIIGMDILGTVGAISIDFKNQYVYLAGAGLLPAETAGLHSYSLARPRK